MDHRSKSPVSRSTTAKIWTARILGSILVRFLFVDGAGKVLRLAPNVEGTVRVGYPESCLIRSASS